MKSRWCSKAAFLSSTLNTLNHRTVQRSITKLHLFSTLNTIGQIVNNPNGPYPNENDPIGIEEKSTEYDWKPNIANFACSRVGLNPSINRFHAPIVYHEHYSFRNWPKTHTFPMDKFERLAHALMTTCKKTLPQQSTLSRPIVRSPNDFFRPLDLAQIPLDWFAEPKGPLDPTFLHKFLNGQLTVDEERWIGFREHTSRPDLIERTVLEVAGTILTSQLAMKYGVASNAAGGTHHANRSRGAGYTILNDLAITANFLTDENLNNNSVLGVKTVLVVDVDVHQGDGTAMFTDLMNTNRLVTLSVHCQDNYPRLKANSTYDIGLPTGCQDDEYMETFKVAVNKAIQEIQPDFILYDAGVDVFKGDKLGKLSVTEAGIRTRDRWLIERCVTGKIPVATVIGGGYDKDVDVLARRHAIVHEECAFVWRKHRMWEQFENP